RFLLSLSSSSFTGPATSALLTLSLHDALPICLGHFRLRLRDFRPHPLRALGCPDDSFHLPLRSPYSPGRSQGAHPRRGHVRPTRSEEHTSELQSRFDLVCRLLLEKKKNTETES